MPIHTLVLSAALTNAAAFAYWAPAAPDQETAPDSSLRAIAEPLVKPIVEAELAPSVSVGVCRGDQVEFFGLGSLPSGEPPTPDTLYEIGSISKVITSLLLADAARTGEVALDTPLNELLAQGVALAPKRDEPVRLWHLATHTSGMTRMPSNFAPANPVDPFALYTEQRLAAELNGALLASEPGTRYAYSNLGAGTLGWALSKTLDTPYEPLVRTRVLEPLGMDNTRIKMDDAADATLAPPTDGHRTTHSWHFTDALAGAGAWRSSTRDLMRLATRMIRPQDQPIDETIAKTLEVRFDPADHDQQDALRMGLGWHLARDGQTWVHSGMTGAYASVMLVNPKESLGVVVLANAPIGQVSAAGEQIIRALAGASEQPMTLREHVPISAEALNRLVGAYKTNAGFTITITRDGDALYAQLTAQPAFRVFPASESLFFYRAVEAELAFDLPEQGPATGLRLLQNGMEFRGERVDD